MRTETAYRCAACADALLFDDGEHTLHCETCGRAFRQNMQPV